MKPIIQKVIISDKIYFLESDVDNWELLEDLFNYYCLDEWVSTLVEQGKYWTIPSNAQHKVEILNIKDNRIWHKLDYEYEYEGILRAEQQEIVNQFIIGRSLKSGLIQAGCGFGKSFTACSLVKEGNVRTLILVHTKLLFRQWINELESQFPHQIIGRIGDGLYNIKDITVGLYKSVHNNIEKIKKEFSLLIVDECHLSSANMFSTTVNNLACKVKIGLSATPMRRDGRHITLEDYFSDFKVIAEDSRKIAKPQVKIIPTDISFYIRNPKREWSAQISKLCSNNEYINLIVKLAIQYSNSNRCILILGDRVAMLKTLNTLIPNSALMIGATKEEERKDILKNAGTTYKVLLSTKLFDEGISCHRLDTLFITCPSSNTIKLEQRIGRILREHPEKKTPLIIDFALRGVIVEGQLQKRINWYESITEKPKKERYEIL